MGSFWPFIAAIAIISIISNMVVQIVKMNKVGGSKGANERMDGLEEDIAQLEADLQDARERIVVLEKIVTDDKQNLSRQIDDLANG